MFKWESTPENSVVEQGMCGWLCGFRIRLKFSGLDTRVPARRNGIFEQSAWPGVSMLPVWTPALWAWDSTRPLPKGSPVQRTAEVSHCPEGLELLHMMLCLECSPENSLLKFNLPSKGPFECYILHEAFPRFPRRVPTALCSSSRQLLYWVVCILAVSPARLHAHGSLFCRVSSVGSSVRLRTYGV